MATASPDPQVSLNLRLASEGEDSAWFTALTILLHLFSLYTAKPRKWLSYLGYAVSVSVGVLSLAQSEAVPCDMDGPVSAGDVYYFFATDTGTTRFVDPDVQSVSTSESSGPSFKSSSPVWEELSSQYEKCPFSKFPVKYCDICPLISHVKGDAYIRRVTRERSGGLVAIEKIDDIRNTLLLEPAMRVCLRKRILAFLPTPNAVLKSNDIAEGADPDARLITDHLFKHQDTVMLSLHFHGKSIALPNEDKRPPEALLTMLYGSTALSTWAPPSALALIKRHAQSMLYADPGCPNSNANVNVNVDEEKEKIRKEWREKRKKERRERLEKRREDEEFDIFDMLEAFGRATRRPPEEARKAAEDERKKASIDKVQGWLADH